MAVIRMKPPRVGKPSGLFFLIRYICDIEKTDDTLILGKDCNPKTAYSEMYLTKQNWSKLDGRQYCHFIQSFSPNDKVTVELAHQLGKRLIEKFSQFDGFEIVMATHKNRSHIHNHFAINSVNATTGLKWEQKAQDLHRLKEFSNLLCGEYELSQIKLRGDKQNQSYGEWANRKNGTSWKAQLESDIRDCLSWCRNRKDFYHGMNELGYEVTWKKERKYITFQNAEGKRCRNSKLSDPSYFSKENMQSIFDNNALDVSLVNTDADLFVDMSHHLAAMFSPDAENQYINDFGSVDLSGLEIKELLVTLKKMKTERELKALREQAEQERKAQSQAFTYAYGNLVDEIERLFGSYSHHEEYDEDELEF